MARHAKRRTASPPQPTTENTRTSLSIRTQLMLFLCVISLALLGSVWYLSQELLQPQYNNAIQRNLTNQLNAIVSLMDNAIADGVMISNRTAKGVSVNQSFKNQLDEAILSNKIQLTNMCVDIADESGLYVMYSENLSPCLLHGSTAYRFGESASMASRDSEDAIILRHACSADGTLSTIISSGEWQQMVVGKTTQNGQYTVLVSASLARVAEAGTVLQDLLPTVALSVLLIALIAAWLFSLWFTKPITQLSAATRAIAKGNYSVAVPVSRNDELGALSHDFNQMAQEVKASAQFQRELLANISHDLRTPLTLIKGYAETVRDLTGESRERRDEQMNIIIDETDRLSGLVGSIMELSKVSSGTEKFEPIRFDLCQFCEEVAERYNGVCATNGWQLQLELPETQPLFITADPTMMERALHNLLGNAMHHLGEDGIFILRVSTLQNGQYRVEIQDHGAGISPEDLPHLFDRYYRSRRNAGKTGTGLGLSITKAIFQQHGFRFGVDSTLGKGTTFWFIVG